MSGISVRATIAGVALLAALAGCSEKPPAPTPSVVSSTPSSCTAAQLSHAQQQGLSAAELLVLALNRGDEVGTRNAFAPDARFDSVGRIYPDREAILHRFLM
jgi:hypothetical protein